jgi:heme exporter protein D
MGHAMRILLAGLLGAIAMYVWTSIAHMVTPLATMGVEHLNQEQAVMDAVRADLGRKSGFFLFPWSEDMSAEGIKAQQARLDANGMGLLVYRAPGTASVSMTGPLVMEFVNELIQALIAAWLLAQTLIASYGRRVLFVMAVGVAVGIGTNVSYHIWYGFPANYTFANVIIQVVGYLAAGLVIAAILRRTQQPA